MALRFKGTELRPVIEEAIAKQCRILLGKDRGVFFIAEKCDVHPATRRANNIAYAVGCNPNVDRFDDWNELMRSELGGDDFGEYFGTDFSLFSEILQTGRDLEMITDTDHEGYQHFLFRVMPQGDNNEQ